MPGTAAGPPTFVHPLQSALRPNQLNKKCALVEHEAVMGNAYSIPPLKRNI